MVNEAVAQLEFSEDERVLDVGCGDGFLPERWGHGAARIRRRGRRLTPDDRHARIAAAPTESGPWFAVADAGGCRSAGISMSWCRSTRCTVPEAAGAGPNRVGGASGWSSVDSGGLRGGARQFGVGRHDGLSWSALGAVVRRFCHAVHSRRSGRYGRPGGFGRIGEDVTSLTASGTSDLEQFERWCAVGSTAWTDLPVGTARGSSRTRWRPTRWCRVGGFCSVHPDRG